MINSVCNISFIFHMNGDTNIYLSKDLLCVQMTTTIKHLEKQIKGVFSKNENMFDK